LKSVLTLSNAPWTIMSDFLIISRDLCASRGRSPSGPCTSTWRLSRVLSRFRSHLWCFFFRAVIDEVWRLITVVHLIAGTSPNLTQVKIWEYLKMETLIEHD
jgi:hypothetical protein